MAKILIVEDNTDLREFLAILLQLKNFEVQGASSRKEVLKELETFTPDLILLDVLLGEDNGREICKEIKKKNREIFIILLSANPKLLLNYKECNADAVIEKPFNNEDILNKIKELLKP